MRPHAALKGAYIIQSRYNTYKRYNNTRLFAESVIVTLTGK